MTIKMRLDTEGLRALIAANPELEIEIGKEVLNNIKADLVAAKVEARITECLKDMCINTGSHWNPKWKATNPVLVEAIREGANEIVRETLSDTINTLAAERVGHYIRIERELLFKDVKALIQTSITPEMAREILIMSLNK